MLEENKKKLLKIFKRGLSKLKKLLPGSGETDCRSSPIRDPLHCGQARAN